MKVCVCLCVESSRIAAKCDYEPRMNPRRERLTYRAIKRWHPLHLNLFLNEYYRSGDETAVKRRQRQRSVITTRSCGTFNISAVPSGRCENCCDYCGHETVSSVISSSCWVLFTVITVKKSSEIFVKLTDSFMNGLIFYMFISQTPAAVCKLHCSRLLRIMYVFM